MNKTQLVDVLAARIGDRRIAATAVDGLLATIVDTVVAGGSVSITGFGVFESRARAARVARNPRTGATVDVAATTVPAFRPGTGFRTAVGGAAPRPTPVPSNRRTRAAATTTEGGLPAPAVEVGAAGASRSHKPARSATYAAEPVAAAQPKATSKGGKRGKAKGGAKVDGRDRAGRPAAPGGKAKGGAKAARQEKPKKAKGKK